MRKHRSLLVIVALLLPLALGAEQAPKPIPQTIAIAPGPFEPTVESLAKSYRFPRWFRDAKLGIWAHWGPQSVPMSGDWYARNMYIQGSGQYEHHLATYGHPTRAGYKDIIPLWRAERWDPDRLMTLYRRAGARYFVSMACHHDNFDLWNSQYHRWNAVNMGPKRDVVGDWQKAARKLGLRFGVSEHMGASFTWFQVAHGSDKTGPLAGVRYDGADPRYEDLYHQPALPGDTGWYSSDPRWHKEWFARVKDVVDSYHPDLLYTDGGIPFGNEVGRSLIAHFYNASASLHGGTPEVVYTCKQASNGGWVEDLERGVMAGIRPYPWQTDTSIGDWYYNRNWKYRSADWVIHTLVDNVSKNGNLLINVVQRPDGSLDPEAEKVLTDMAAWIAVNGESIYGTRPWMVYGEGPVRARGGSFGEDFAYTARDIRFAQKGSQALYVTVMGWPEDGKVVVRSLSKFPGVTGRITGVTLLGSPARLAWTHDADGLTVQLPALRPSEYAVVLKVRASNLRGFKPEMAAPPAPTVKADASGAYTLAAADAELHGEQLKLENQGGQPNLGFWDNPADWVSWKVSFAEPGRYRVSASCAAANGESAMAVEAAGQKLPGRAPATGAWDTFQTFEVGTLEVKNAGDVRVAVRPRDAASWKAINLRWLKLTPVRAL